MEKKTGPKDLKNNEKRRCALDMIHKKLLQLSESSSVDEIRPPLVLESPLWMHADSVSFRDLLSIQGIPKLFDLSHTTEDHEPVRSLKACLWMTSWRP